LEQLRLENRENFSGLPLTLLFIAFIYVLSLFFGIIQAIVFSALVAAYYTLAVKIKSDI